MKTQRTRRAGLVALAIAVTGFLAVAPSASAQYPTGQYPNSRGGFRRRAMETRSYERMRQWAHDLGELAEHASQQARLQQGPYRGFRRDTKFLRSIDQFADRAQRFHERMDTYQTQPWNVDDELVQLTRGAQNVQYRLRRARFVDQHTVADWNQVVNLLNRMTTEYQAGLGYRNRRPVNGDYRTTDPYPTGDYRNDPNPNPNGYRYDPNTNNRDYRGDNRGDSGRYGNSSDIRQLAIELDQRAARASQLATGYAGYSSDIRRFSEQARDFRNQVEGNQMDQNELRTEVNQLLDDAQNAYSELRQRNVTSQVASEWDSIVQILNRMRDLTG
jgi:methyl-accepting chemotaxis protein